MQSANGNPDGTNSETVEKRRPTQSRIPAPIKVPIDRAKPPSSGGAKPPSSGGAKPPSSDRAKPPSSDRAKPPSSGRAHISTLKNLEKLLELSRLSAQSQEQNYTNPEGPYYDPLRMNCEWLKVAIIEEARLLWQKKVHEESYKPDETFSPTLIEGLNALLDRFGERISDAILVKVPIKFHIENEFVEHESNRSVRGWKASQVFLIELMKQAEEEFRSRIESAKLMPVDIRRMNSLTLASLFLAKERSTQTGGLSEIESDLSQSFAHNVHDFYCRCIERIELHLSPGLAGTETQNNVLVQMRLFLSLYEQPSVGSKDFSLKNLLPILGGNCLTPERWETLKDDVKRRLEKSGYYSGVESAVQTSWKAYATVHEETYPWRDAFDDETLGLVNGAIEMRFALGESIDQLEKSVDQMKTTQGLITDVLQKKGTKNGKGKKETGICMALGSNLFNSDEVKSSLKEIERQITAATERLSTFRGLDKLKSSSKASKAVIQEGLMKLRDHERHLADLRRERMKTHNEINRIVLHWTNTAMEGLLLLLILTNSSKATDETANGNHPQAEQDQMQHQERVTQNVVRVKSMWKFLAVVWEGLWDHWQESGIKFYVTKTGLDALKKHRALIALLRCPSVSPSDSFDSSVFFSSPDASELGEDFRGVSFSKFLVHCFNGEDPTTDKNSAVEELYSSLVVKVTQNDTNKP